MKKQTLKLVLAVCVLIAVAFTATAIAHEDNERTDQEQSNTSEQERFRKQQMSAAEDRVNEIKQIIEAKKTQLKMDVCEKRQSKIQAKMPRLANSAVKLQEVIDKINDRVQHFYESGQLTVTNYEQLKAEVDKAQADTETAVNAVKSFNIEFECDDPDAGKKLAGFRESIKAAKDSLKEYREALVNLISAMKAAAADDGDV